MIAPGEVGLGAATAFGCVEIETGGFYLLGQITYLNLRAPGWRRAGAGPYKGVCRASEAGAPADSMLKQLLSNPIVQFLIGRAIGLYMGLAGATTRWERVNEAAAAPFRAEGKLIVAVWHGRFMLVHKLWWFGPGEPKAMVLISQSREGGIVAEAARAVGAVPVRGSTAKGGRMKGGLEAMRGMARHIQDGGIVCITPDGPKGPRMRVKPGTVHLAKLARAPLVGMAWSTRRRRALSSWDRMTIPALFDRGVLIWSVPIAPPAPNASAADIEAVRLAFETEMNRIAAEADRRMGHEPIAPAAPESAERPAQSATAP